MSTPVPDTPSRNLRKRARVDYTEQLESDLSDRDSGYQSTDSNSSIVFTKRRKPVKRALPKRKIFPFLSLPGELRNKIYAYCLADDSTGIQVEVETKAHRTYLQRAHYADMASQHQHQPQADAKMTEKARTFSPALLCVNRQIHAEAACVLYSNEIILTNPLALHAFLAHLSPKTRALVRHLRLASWATLPSAKGFNQAGLTLLKECPNLTSIYFQNAVLPRHWYLGPTVNRGKKTAKKLYALGQFWLEELARDKGAEAVLKVLLMDRVPPHNLDRTSMMPLKIESNEELAAFKICLMELLNC